MSKLRKAKILGGIGALLMLIGGIASPGLGCLLGLILLFVAIKYIADTTSDESIFDNYLMHFILTILAVIAVVLIFFYSVGGLTFFSLLEETEFTDAQSVYDFFEPYIGWWILALVVGWVFIVISAIYLKKSYESIAEHTNVSMFKTTGKIYFIGAILLIVIVGILILFIAKILEIVAFFSLPEELPKKAEVGK